MIAAKSINHLPLEEKTIAKVLKENGYSTFHVGKWHLGKPPSTPENHGYEINIGGCHWGHPKHGFFSPYKIPNFEDGEKGEYLTDRLTDEAIDLVKKCTDKPFFLFLAYYAVHVPIQAPESLIEKYKEKSKDLGFDSQRTFEVGNFFHCTHKKYNRITRRLIQSDPTYAGMIERLDWNIGRLMDKLKELNLDENTIIIFFSDNGGLATAESSPTCNAPLSEGKGWAYEGGIRVPLIIKWSRISKIGIECSIPVISTDFYPTILEMIGLKSIPKQHLDGKSIVPFLLDTQALREDPIFWHYPHYSNQGDVPSSVIREEKYKLIAHHEDHSLELYDIREDMGEKNNLFKIKPNIVEDLHEKLLKWYKKVDADLPEPNPRFNKRFGNVIYKIMAFGYKIFTRINPKFKKIRRSISKHLK